MTGERLAEAWRAYRAYLVDLAYRMLGDVGHAEDVVQEAFIRLANTEPDAVDDPRAWLTVVTSRLCLDQLRSARSRREHPDDTALREATTPLAHPPAVDPADRITLDDEVRLALLVVLQRLSPPERVAFVLHDVFQTPFDTIAETLGRPAATCRQLARRARQKIAAAPLRPHEVDLQDHRAVTDRFITACANGDIDALLAVLHPRVWGTADLGADSPFQPPPTHGADQVAENLLRYFGRATLVAHPVLGPPTLFAFTERTPFAVLLLTMEHDLVSRIQVIVDPDLVPSA
ncbi:RNA polymerase sigma factor SigI [Pseudonocardia acaciae]|uniref:RNA polymerase sigma factor SigI n=1 Tax=Pseudonocardia acaciae TaxID=551276 RepID=UPI00048B0CF9|nr:RNA polymerase sigma factor SigI [Pseudonocardia acaciae]